MKLTITVNQAIPGIEVFMFNYLPKYIIDLFLKSVNYKKLKLIDSYYKINSKEVILFALHNMSKSKINNSMYTIGVNKNLKYKGDFLIKYIHQITYGDLAHKGYRILLDIFKDVAERVDLIYEGWLQWQ